MKKYLFILILMTLVATNSIFAQSDAIGDFLKQKTGGKSFANIDDYLAKTQTDFDNTNEVIKLFNQERIRLGANFETELWKYLGNDLRKHYWISSFVEYEGYLNGNPPLLGLAAQIRSNAQNFPVKSDDYELLGMKFSLLRRITVDLFESKRFESAKLTKQKAELIYKEIEQLGVVGAEDEYIVCIYDNLEKNTTGCKKENAVTTSNSQTGTDSRTLSGGIMNGKAISIPAPEYPKAASAVGATGAVNVEVMVDEAGNVISAEAVSGHSLLRQAAVNAAKQAKFKPTVIDGQARKVIGIIVYNFSK